MPSTMLMPKRSTKPGLSMIAVRRQVGDDAAVADVEMAAIDAAGLQRLEDVARVLARCARARRAAWLASLEELREVRLRTSCGSRSSSGGSRRSRRGSSRSRSIQLIDLVGALAVPRQVFATGGRSTRSSRSRSASARRSGPSPACEIDRMRLEGGEQLVATRPCGPWRGCRCTRSGG